VSNIGLFAAGFLVTMIVSGALALLFWGAILDGRYETEQRAASRERMDASDRDLALHPIDASL
jgi:hypothetical protein